MDRRRVGLQSLATIVGALTLLGCQAEPERNDSSLITAKASAPPSDEVGLGATLTIEDGCVYLVSVDDGGRFTAVWPHGARLDAEQTMISLPDGRGLVAGDTLVLGGWLASLDDALGTSIDGVSDAAVACIDAGSPGLDRTLFVIAPGSGSVIVHTGDL